MNSSSIHKKEVPSLYALKAVCALFVVIIHYPFTYLHITHPITAIAVPCFYMITGYFLNAGDIGGQIQRAFRWSRKACILTLFVNAAYMALYYVIFSKTYTWEQWARSFVIGDDISCHLWYLSSLWQSLLILVLILKFKPSIVAYLPLLLLHNIAKGYCSHLFGIEQSFFLYYPPIFAALPYLALGYIIRFHEALITHKSKLLFSLFGCFLLFSYAEHSSLSCIIGENYCSPLFSTPFLSLAVFLLSLAYRAYGGRYICHIGKYHSANIYYMHMAVGTLIVTFSSKFLHVGCYKFLIIYAASLLLSYFFGRAALLFKKA